MLVLRTRSIQYSLCVMCASALIKSQRVFVVLRIAANHNIWKARETNGWGPYDAENVEGITEPIKMEFAV